MKFRFVNNGVTEEFDTLSELMARIAEVSQNDPLVVMAMNEMSKEEMLSRGLSQELRLEFKKQVQAATLTLAQATDIFNRIVTTFTALNAGWLRESRMLANNTVVGGSFTQPRKDFLLARIDAAIAQL